MQFSYFLMYVTTFFGLFTSLYFFITLYENRDKITSPHPNRLPSVTVIVPDYGHPEPLRLTIESLLALDYPKSRLNIFVVINGIESSLKTEAYKMAKNYSSVKAFYIGNVGKGGAINHALKYTKTELVGALDADCFCDANALKRMVGFFENPNVMAVTPSMQIANAKNGLQKLQKIEFMMGVLLRKVFAFMGSIHVTPGPFTIYRTLFFDKYGGYDESTITEDIEIAMRIQDNNYVIENSLDSLVYTEGVKKFWPLFNQRIRWYRGFIENTVKYRNLFGPRTGNLGLFVLPASFFSVFLFAMMMIMSIFYFVKNGIVFLKNWSAIGFSLKYLSYVDFTNIVFFTNSNIILGLISVFIGIVMVMLSKKLSYEKESIKFSFILHFFVYWYLFIAWWSVAVFYYLTGKKIKWGPRKG